VPLLSLGAGYAMDTFLPEKAWALYIALITVICIGLYRQRDIYTIPEHQKKYHRLEAICDRYIPANSMILTAGEDGDPSMMYFCHRRGWSDDERWKDVEWIRGERTVGMEYLVIERERLDTSLPLALIYEDEDFVIYETTQ
jgi:hypothetical protein